MPIDRRMDKEDVVHIYNGILFSNKNNEIMQFAATWMDLEIIILSEVRQRKTNIVCYYICEIQENDTDELWKAATDPQTQKQSYGY